MADESKSLSLRNTETEAEMDNMTGAKNEITVPHDTSRPRVHNGKDKGGKKLAFLDDVFPPVVLPSPAFIDKVSSAALQPLAAQMGLTGNGITGLRADGTGMCMLNRGWGYGKWYSFALDISEVARGSAFNMICIDVKSSMAQAEAGVVGMLDKTGSTDRLFFQVGGASKSITPTDSSPICIETNGETFIASYKGTELINAKSASKTNVVFFMLQNCILKIIPHPSSSHPFLDKTTFAPNLDVKGVLPPYGLKNLTGTQDGDLFALTQLSIEYLKTALSPRVEATYFSPSDNNRVSPFILEGFVANSALDYPMFGFYVGQDGITFSFHSNKDSNLSDSNQNHFSFVKTGGKLIVFSKGKILETINYSMSNVYVALGYDIAYLFYKNTQKAWVKHEYPIAQMPKAISGVKGSMRINYFGEAVQINAAFPTLKNKLKVVAAINSVCRKDVAVARTLKSLFTISHYANHLKNDDGAEPQLVTSKKLYERETHAEQLLFHPIGTHEVIVKRQPAGRYRVNYQAYDVSGGQLIGSAYEHTFTISKNTLNESHIPILYDYLDDTYLLLSIFVGTIGATGQKTKVALKSPKGKTVHNRFRITKFERVGGYKQSEYQ